MKRTIFLALFLILLCTVTVLAESTTFQARTNMPDVNLRARPDSKSGLVGQIEDKGTKVNVTRTAEDKKGNVWCYSKTSDGKHGYILSKYLTPLDGATIPASSSASAAMTAGTTGMTGTTAMVSSWQDAYASFILNEGYKLFRGPRATDVFVLNDPTGSIDFGLCDMDRNGIPELIATNGDSSMAGKTNLIFTFANNTVTYVGNAGFRESIMVAIDSPVYSGLFCQDGNMGYYETFYYSLVNGTIVTEAVRESDHNGADGQVIDNPTPKQLTKDNALYQASLTDQFWKLNQFSVAQIRQMGFNAFLTSNFFNYQGYTGWEY